MDARIFIFRIMHIEFPIPVFEAEEPLSSVLIPPLKETSAESLSKRSGDKKRRSLSRVLTILSGLSRTNPGSSHLKDTSKG